MEHAIKVTRAMNQQMWHFTIIQNRDVLQKIADMARESMESGGGPMARKSASPDFALFCHAPTVIVITGDLTSRSAETNCSLAVQSIALTAEFLNIGACMMTWPALIFRSENGRELLKELGVPEGYSHVCTVTLGYGDDDSPQAKPRNEEVINYVR